MEDRTNKLWYLFFDISRHSGIFLLHFYRTTRILLCTGETWQKWKTGRKYMTTKYGWHKKIYFIGLVDIHYPVKYPMARKDKDDFGDEVDTRVSRYIEKWIKVIGLLLDNDILELNYCYFVKTITENNMRYGDSLLHRVSYIIYILKMWMNQFKMRE